MVKSKFKIGAPMKPSAALQANRTAIRAVVERYRACNARVFGSVVHGDDQEGSDLDILIDPTPDKFRGLVLAEAVPV